MGQNQSLRETKDAECEQATEAQHVRYRGNQSKENVNGGTNLKDTVDIENVEIPFLRSHSSKEYIRNSKAMFVMRGIPGSKRSVVVKQIKLIFNEAVICSTSEYFMQDGRYDFDPSKLEEAKIFCQEKARNACEGSKHVVVIDNTNMRKWEMKYYFRLAMETCYVVVLVEPWKFNMEELLRQNQHTADIEQLSLQLQQWETIIPLYYGWFLNEADSRALKLVGMAYLEECLSIPEFAEDYKAFTQTSDLSGSASYYTTPESSKAGMLHCTAKFCSFGDVPGSYEYAMKKEVLEACGNCYNLHIIGFVMTPRTFGARVKLSEEELKLWDNNELTPTLGMTPRNSLHHNPNINRYRSTNSITKQQSWFPHCQATLVCSDVIPCSFEPVKGSGCRAHITLGYAEGVPAVTTGYDLLEVVECEVAPDVENTCKTYTLARGWLRDYGKSRWVLYLGRQITVASLFTGAY